jgi:aspartate 1-decarboxylase
MIQHSEYLGRKRLKMIKTRILEILNSHVGNLFSDYTIYIIEHQIMGVLTDAKHNYNYDYNIIRIYKNWLIINVSSFNKITTYELKFDKHSGEVKFNERTQ